MATDVKLDQVDGSFLVLEGRVVKAAASDFMLDSPERHKSGTPFRRAMVHNQSDGLTINFNGDYPGGVTLVGVRVLEVKGDITFGRRPGGINATKRGTVENPEGSGTGMVPVSLTAEINNLQSQINQLVAKVAALEAKK